MEHLHADAAQRYADLVARGSEAVLGLDFDGTLAPIVEDPTRARIHPDAAAAVLAAGRHLGAVAVITGRPVRQALDLGDLAELSDGLVEAGRELFVLGQYGNERWSSSHPEVVVPPVPAGVDAFAADLPAALRSADAADAYIEDKGLAVAVHTRRLADASAAYNRLLPVLGALADTHGLTVEPGRQVIEVRGGETHKGEAVRTLAAELDARGFCFVGDDLGDVEAFRAVEELRADGMAGLLVCSGSEEQPALRDLADVLVPGPDGVVAFLWELAADLAARPLA